MEGEEQVQLSLIPCKEGFAIQFIECNDAPLRKWNLATGSNGRGLPRSNHQYRTTVNN